MNPVNLEGALVLGELLKVALGQLLLDLRLMGRIHQGDASPFEACSRETTAINTWQGTHDLIDGDELWGATFVIMNGTLTAIETQFSEEFQIACLPGSHPLTDTTILGVKVLGPTGKPGWHGDARLLERGLGNIAQEGLVEGLQGLVGIGQHVPCSRLTLVNTEVIVGIHQRACQSREENTNLELRHIGMALNDAPLVTVAIQEEQSVCLS